MTIKTSIFLLERSCTYCHRNTPCSYHLKSKKTAMFTLLKYIKVNIEEHIQMSRMSRPVWHIPISSACVWILHFLSQPDQIHALLYKQVVQC